MTKWTKAGVAQKVREYLVDRHPGGITLNVVDDDVIRYDNWWRVPVRPSAWPARLFEYYETLAEVEGDLQEREHLDVLIATGEPDGERLPALTANAESMNR